MFWVSFIVFILLIVGFFLILNLSPKTISSDLDEILNPKDKIKTKVLKAQNKKKTNKFMGFLKEMQNTMSFMGQSNKFTIVCLFSIILSAIGIISCVYIDNIFLAPAFLIGFFSIPFIFVRLYSYSYAKQLQNELEIALSQITTSYQRTDDITGSIEENLKNLHPIIKTPFEEFVNQIKYINSNERQAIEDLSTKIDNDIFKEWCNALIKCSQNRSLKYLLSPVIEKFSILRTIDSEISIAFSQNRFSFLVIAGIVWGNIPMLHMISKDWYKVLVSTTQGHFTIGLVALVTVICAIILIILTKPLKYKV